MINVFVEKNNVNGDIIEIIEKSDINHLKNVFRIKNGDIIRVVDGEYEYITKVIEIDNKLITLKVEKSNFDNDLEKVEIDACISVLKNDKMDLVIQKLTEIGIKKIIPLFTKRGVVKLSEKKDKWDLIAKEALKQCGGIKKMEFDNITKVEEINYKEYDLIIVPYECEEEKKIFTIFEGIKPKKVLYVIGPEGGFEKEEIDKFVKEGAVVVTLGKRILRAETAAIVTGGILINGFN